MIDFQKYDSENPEIWDMFKRIAREAKLKGFKHYSANGIFEIIRWETKVSGKDGFKVNNNFRADYARKLMAQDPEFLDFFRIRETKTGRA